MKQLAVIAGLFWTANAWAAAEQNVLGWTRDGASLVYKAADDTGTEEEGGTSGRADLAIVVDATTGALQPYLLDLGDATADEKKRYHALPGRAAFEAWLKAHPVDCASGRQSPDGKARADIKVHGKDFQGAWSGDRYAISPSDTEEPTTPEGFQAELSIKRDGKAFPPSKLTGRIAFSGNALGSAVGLCWAPDGTRVASVVHTDRTMRDPEANDVRLSFVDRPALDPESVRTAELRQANLARRANAAGMKAYRSQNYLVATKKFREAIAGNATYVTAHYNLACVAALQGDRAAAIVELKWLAASTDPEAKAKLKKAPTDPDLRSLANEPGAKPFFTP